MLKSSLTDNEELRALDDAEYEEKLQELEWKQALQAVKKKIHTTEQVKKPGNNGVTPLHEECSKTKPNPEVIKYYLVLDADANARDRDEWTPLHCLCRGSGDPRSIEALSTYFTKKPPPPFSCFLFLLRVES